MGEEVLLERARSGDRRAFGQLVTPHRNHLWAVCLQITGHAQDAEDALQNTLVSAWQKLDSFRGQARLSTWLHRIAANSALMLVRRRREVLDADLGAHESSSASPIDARVGTVDAVRAALLQLDPVFREAVVLREYADLSYAEIAEHQRVPVQTVRSRINRGRTRLRGLLADHA